MNYCNSNNNNNNNNNNDNNKDLLHLLEKKCNSVRDIFYAF